MALEIHHGEMVPDTDTAFALHDLSFTPKAVIFWGADMDANDEAVHGGTGSDAFAGFTIGFQADVAGQGSTKAASRGFMCSRPTFFYETAGVSSSSHAYKGLRYPLADYADFYINAYNADGFTLSNNGAFLYSMVNRPIQYVAIGGSSVLNVKKISQAWPAAIGTQVINLGFRPSLLIFLCRGAGGGFGVGATLGWGAATGAGAQFAQSHMSPTGLGTFVNNQKSVHRDDMVLIANNSETGALEGLAQLISIDATGFQLDVQATPGVGIVYDVLAVEFDTDTIAECGTFAKNSGTSSSTQDITSAVKPTVLMVTSCNKLVNANPTDDLTFSMGAIMRSDTYQACIAGDVINEAAPVHKAGKFSRGKVMSILKSETSTVECAANAILNPAGFRMTYNPNTARASQVSYIAIGPPADTPDPTEPPEEPAIESRIWPFEPDWTVPPESRFQFLSDIVPGHDGTEQRIQLRTRPRPILKYSVFTTDDKQSADMDALLWQWSGRRWAFPYWPDQVQLDSALIVGATNIPCVTDYRQFAVDGYAILWRDYRTYELVQIAGVNAGSIDIVDGTVGAWAADGRTLVIPAFYGRQDADQAVIAITSPLRGTDLLFEAEAGEIVTLGAWPQQYESVDVMHLPPNRVTEFTHTMKRSTFVLDSKVGRHSIYDRAEHPFLQRQDMPFVLEGRAEIDTMLAFVAARKGMVKPFWMPTWNRDLVLRADVAPSAGSISVQDIGYTDRMFPNLSRRRIAIMANGLQYYRKVTASVASGGGETLTLDSALPDAIAKQNCMISFLTLNRMAGDDVLWRWHTTDVAEAMIAPIEIPNEVTA